MWLLTWMPARRGGKRRRSAPYRPDLGLRITLTDGEARRQAVLERAPFARLATPGMLDARSAWTKPRAARTRQAWQPRSGARHNATFREPAGRAAVAPPSGAQRNDWGDFAECRVMLKRAQRARFTPERLCLAVVDPTDGGARRHAPPGARHVARERTKRGRCFPRSGWRDRAATDWVARPATAEAVSNA